MGGEGRGKEEGAARRERQKEGRIPMKGGMRNAGQRTHGRGKEEAGGGKGIYPRWRRGEVIERVLLSSVGRRKRLQGWREG